MSAPASPDSITFPKDSLVYRGKTNVNLVQTGNWFAYDKNVAISYAGNRGVVCTYKVTRNLNLVDMQGENTRDYILSYSPSADNPYEQYISSGDLEPVPKGEDQKILYVDMDGTAAEMKKFLETLAIREDGWWVGDEARWPPSSKNKGHKFHSEVMIFKPRESLQLVLIERVRVGLTNAKSAVCRKGSKRNGGCC